MKSGIWNGLVLQDVFLSTVDDCSWPQLKHRGMVGAFVWWSFLPSWSPVVLVLMRMMMIMVLFKLRWQRDDLVKMVKDDIW